MTSNCYHESVSSNNFPYHSGIIASVQLTWSNIFFSDSAAQCTHRCDFGPQIRGALATFKGNFYRKKHT
jgi:hypothetical protein